MWQSVSLLTRRNDIVQTCYGIRNSNRQKAIDSLSGDFSYGKLVSSDHITISKDNFRRIVVTVDTLHQFPAACPCLIYYRL